MESNLSSIRGIGPSRRKAFQDAGIRTVRDLVMLLPKDYRDLTRITPPSALQAGVPAAVRVRVSGDVRQQHVKKLVITRVFVTDGEDVISVVWYNQPWLKDQLSKGRELILYGKAEWRKGVLQLSCPTIEQSGGLIPVYRTIPGIPAKSLRRAIDAALDICDGSWPEDLPEEIRRRGAGWHSWIFYCIRGHWASRETRESRVSA